MVLILGVCQRVEHVPTSARPTPPLRRADPLTWPTPRNIKHPLVLFLSGVIAVLSITAVLDFVRFNNSFEVYICLVTYYLLYGRNVRDFNYRLK